MTKTADTILKELKSGTYHPFYFLHGDESYYIDAISDYIEENALNSAERGFNQMILYGKDTTMGSILNQARRFPMMSNRQVVIVKELQEMSDWNKPGSNQLLDAYLKNPQPSTILVLNHKHKTLNKNTKLYKALVQGCVVIESRKIYENQVFDWIKTHLKEKNLNIEHKATQLLIEAVGANLGRLSKELEKLALNIPANTMIEEKSIEEYVGISKDYNVFELQKAIATRNFFKVQQIIHYWESNPKKQPLIPTLALLFSFFSRVLLAYSQQDRSDNHLAKVLKVGYYFVKEYKMMMQNYSKTQIIRSIHYLRTADLQVKGIVSGGHTEAQILKELVFRIMH